MHRCPNLSVAAVMVIVIAGACHRDLPNVSRFRFTVVDVGQGLAQIGVSAATAVAWDMGPASAMASWQAAYGALGSPALSAIVISHGHADHCGGLLYLPDTLDFSGLIVVSWLEDTAFLRELCPLAWKSKVTFRMVKAGDTIGGLAGVLVECLWPPSEVSENGDSVRSASMLENRYSLVFLLSCGVTRLLISSDVDTVAQRMIARQYRWALRADIAIAPHHGSASAVDPVFFGYVAPRVIIVSCAAPPNAYGHPSATLLDLAFQMGTSLWSTYEEGTIVLLSNGEYWQSQEQPLP